MSESDTVEIKHLTGRLNDALSVIRLSKRYDVVGQKNVVFTLEYILDRVHRLDEEQADTINTCLAGNCLPRYFTNKDYTRQYGELLDSVQAYVDNPTDSNSHTMHRLDDDLMKYRHHNFDLVSLDD